MTTNITNNILAWEDDPISTPSVQPISRPVPQLQTPPLPIEISGAAPTPQPYPVGTEEFRYWTAAEALRRGTEFWGGLLPNGVSWQRGVGSTLEVFLDSEREDFNAFYERQRLVFFHGTDAETGIAVFSGESPDVCCHELGHAILDGLRPQLFNAFFIEAAAFHESFGDISSILCALQLPSVRQEVLAQTGGQIYRSSRLSRLAEQLASGIRQINRQAVESDCLRNAVNLFFYRNPETLPPSGPAVTLTSEPHSFSRVFTGGFFEALSNMLLVINSAPTEDDLLQVSEDAARLIIDGILASPIVPEYFSQVAAHIIEADSRRFQGKYSEALRRAFVKHGILSLQSAGDIGGLQRSMVSSVVPRAEEAPLERVAISGRSFGLNVDAIIVDIPIEVKRFQVSPSRLSESATPSSSSNASRIFIEHLCQRENIATNSPRVASMAAIASPEEVSSLKTHQLVEEDGQLILKRKLFDCGIKCCCQGLPT